MSQQDQQRLRASARVGWLGLIMVLSREKVARKQPRERERGLNSGTKCFKTRRYWRCSDQCTLRWEEDEIQARIGSWSGVEDDAPTKPPFSVFKDSR